MSTVAAPMLTDRQAEILAFIKIRIRDGVPPTTREIGKRFDISSPNGVSCHLKSLRRKGFIEWDENLSRSIRLVGLVTCPCCEGLGEVAKDQQDSN